MKVFLGWSGDLSRQLADAFHDWIMCVVQDAEPFLSSRDIDKGLAWMACLTEALKGCSFGIFFLTGENQTNTWMHFEAGAVLKQIGESKVFPLLFNDMTLRGPFSGFQATRFEREEVWKLVWSLNKSMPKPVIEPLLKRCFATHWPDLDARIQEIRSKEHAGHRGTASDPRTMEVVELRELTGQLLAHERLHLAGLRDIYETRLESLPRMRQEIESETKEIIVVGSSLKGIIGVGGGSGGEQNLIRMAMIDAMAQRNTRVKILMTNPEVAHHRSRQEGKETGEIESEIVENLIYLLRERLYSKEVDRNLEVKLYNGTPTIFLLCTSHVMFHNPYTFYSKAFESYCFRAEAGSKLFDHYYRNHYQAAWDDRHMTEPFPSDHGDALGQIERLITAKNQHGDAVIPQKTVQRDLLRKLKALANTDAR